MGFVALIMLQRTRERVFVCYVENRERRFFLSFSFDGSDLGFGFF